MINKKLLFKITAFILLVILLFGMSIISVSAKEAIQKTYLDTMGYISFNSTCSHNNGSPFEGIDGHGNECEHAYQFYIDSDYENYSNAEELKKVGNCSYTVSFNLEKKYNEFVFNLTAGERLDTNSARISIIGDGKHLFGNGITDKTNQVAVSINVTDIEILTFEIQVGFTTYPYYDNHYIILNNAYFTSEGTKPDLIPKPEIVPSYSLGDVDGDGIVAVKDVTYIQLHLANLGGLTDEGKIAADYDKDGSLTVKDATYIQLYLANLL